MRDIDAVRDDATRSSGGGIGFLLAYALTLAVAGLAALLLPAQTAALVVLFQGGAALPLAFILERVLGFPKMAADNPLRTLSIQLAMTQVVALPAVIIVYSLQPLYVPAAFAAVGGGHFLPYVWLHRTRLYAYLGVAVSLGSFALTFVAGDLALTVVPLFWSLSYLIAAALIYRTVTRRHRSQAATASISDQPTRL
jgi:hypothetical protein